MIWGSLHFISLYPPRLVVHRKTIIRTPQLGYSKSRSGVFLAIHGRLQKGTVDIANDATLMATFRSGPPFKGKLAFTWSINGEKGEILVMSTGGPYLYSGSHGEPINIELHDHVTDEIVNIEWDWKDWQKELPLRARIVADVYERYARWSGNGKPASVPDGQNWPRVHDGVARLKDFKTLFQQYDTKENRST